VDVARVAAPRRDTYTGRVRPWIKYTLIRIVLFAGVLAILMLFTPAPPWLATVIAAIVGLCISYIFFRPQRDELAESIASRRARGETNADEDEDDALNRSA
jgi:L-asparagine transporter-like permease